MGRTRSLRYALRKGGKKYDAEHGGKEIPRDGTVYDDEKLRGSKVFEEYLRRINEDETYVKAWDEWKANSGTGMRKRRRRTGSEMKEEYEEKEEEKEEEEEEAKDTRVKMEEGDEKVNGRHQKIEAKGHLKILEEDGDKSVTKETLAQGRQKRKKRIKDEK
ncbi:hypothetical protein P7C73_g365, partial [Tremellales sp. Uapishka_1]